jgi:hypothetical protein
MAISELMTTVATDKYLAAKAGKLSGYGGRKLTDDTLRLARRAAVWELRCNGLTQQEIADHVGASQSTVGNDLDWCHREVTDDIVEDVWRVKAEQLSRLELVFAEAMRAWYESKEDAIEFSSKAKPLPASSGQSGAGAVQPVEQNTRVIGQTGDPRYLSAAMKALADQREILGLDSPLKLAHTDPSGTQSAPGLVVVIPHNNRENLDDLGGQGGVIIDQDQRYTVQGGSGDGSD